MEIWIRLLKCFVEFTTVYEEYVPKKLNTGVCDRHVIIQRILGISSRNYVFIFFPENRSFWPGVVLRYVELTIMC